VISRFNRTAILDNGSQFGTCYAAEVIQAAIASGQIKTTTMVMREGMRADAVAAQTYGDARLWWVIAASSGIAWAMQCPPGTILTLPNLADVAALVG
jgi:hypothetical protein